MVKVHAVPVDAEETILRLVRQRRSRLTTTILFMPLRQRCWPNANLSRRPAFAKHADANIERLVAADPPSAAYW